MLWYTFVVSFAQQMLSDVPDYAERCQFLETLKNRLEATLSPQLVAAFNSQSLGKQSVLTNIGSIEIIG